MCFATLLWFALLFVSLYHKQQLENDYAGASVKVYSEFETFNKDMGVVIHQDVNTYNIDGDYTLTERAKDVITIKDIPGQ